ncbi:MAG: hypothetical protein RLY65_2121 [Pseudomonadota bacterium]
MKTKDQAQGSLTRERLFIALAPRIEKHHIEGLGEVHFRQLSLQEIDSLSKRKQLKGDEDAAVAVLCLCLVDAEGRRLLLDEDVEALKACGFRSLEALIAKAAEVNGQGALQSDPKPLA